MLGLLTVRAPSRVDGTAAAQEGSSALHQLRVVIESVFAAVLILVALFGTGTYFPQVCEKCHGEQEHYRTWRASTHKTVTCRRCHWEPGLTGLAQAEVDVVRMARTWVNTPGSAAGGSARVSVPNQACGACHRDIARGTTGGRIKVSHREFWDTRHACTSCHATTGHAAQTDVRATTMNLCLECHDGVRVQNQCGLCHSRGGFGPEENVSAADYPRAQIARRDCEGCHSTAPCTQCHGVYMPHPFPYAQGGDHAKDAFARPGLCLKYCHTTSDCRKCHSRVGGHGPNWKTAHGATGTAFCNIACHHQTYVVHLPGVTPSVTFCDNCHRGPLPKPRDGAGAP